ncbi:hypothetical protein PIB30_000134 [Stylosanthes scabra]|uniref:Uncharacterized protein n=1 Tax=Stylosanthes scabra TaxID=79078 RepID=A0ABU6R3H8_9FABA|nr:hypothetical protein [Stylosanthes scabra]
MSEASNRVKTSSEHSDSEISETEQPLTLYLMTPYYMCGFQLDPNPRQPPQSSDPSIKVSIDFFGASYPIRMGIVKFDTKLWFFGGVSGFPHADLNSNGTSPNLRVFELDQSNGCLFPADEFPNLRSPKRQPIVVRFGDKIFVHHVTDFGPRNLPPVLECLHVPSKTWETIPLV